MNVRVLGLLCAGLFLASGCAETQYVMRYGTEGVQGADLPRWPPPPEVPRYVYAGMITGEENYEVIENQNQTTLQKAVAWVVGLALPRGAPRRLQRPQAGMVDESGRILVTDNALGAVFVFDEPNGLLRIWTRLDAERPLVSPVGIVPGPDGQVLVADADWAVVTRLATDGTPLGLIGEGLLKRPTGLVRDAEQGLIYVADTHAHDIKVFNDDGELIEVIGARGEQVGEFNYPTHLALRKGRLHVVDTMNTRVQVLDINGDVKRTFGERGLLVGNLVRPKGVSVDSDGNIYVIESFYDHMLVYNAQGQLLLPIGGEGQGLGQFYLPSGVWLDQRDRVFVADSFNGRVVVFQYLGS